MIRLIGLSGGIGAGKSTVADMLGERGIGVIDADVLARQVVQPGLPAYREIVGLWPEVAAQDRTIDRKKLATIVFADPSSQARLQAITHPRIREEVARQANALADAGQALAFLEAALIVESGYYKELDGLIVVIADEAVRIARVVARDGCTREAAVARVRAQGSQEEKVRVATHVIDNNGDLGSTRAQVEAVLAHLARP